MHLSLHQITTFREVMKCGSISEAARAVARTQPAVSTLIRTLEDQLGFALFERRKGKLIPTPEALFFLEECEDILARVERTERSLARIKAGQAGRLRIACHPAAATFFVPRLLTQFLEERPSLDVAFSMQSSDVIDDLISSQQYDIGFAESSSKRSTIDRKENSLECVCLLSARHPAAHNAVITPQLLDGNPMAVLFEEHQMTRQLRAAFESAGSSFRKRFELRTVSAGLHFVEAGLCAMVCDMITAYSYLLQNPQSHKIVMRRFLPRIATSLSILTPAYRTPSLGVQGFISKLEQALADMQSEMEKRLGEPGA